MPTISRFLGIIITMYYPPKEHNPPHFHVRFGEFKAVMELENMIITEGSLPKNIEKIVMKWAIENKKELWENWNLAQNMEELKKIKGGN